jgi:hypothetical protein
MHDVHVVGIIDLGDRTPTCLAERGRVGHTLARSRATLPARSEWLEADLEGLSAELHSVAGRVLARVAALRRPYTARNR